MNKCFGVFLIFTTTLFAQNTDLNKDKLNEENIIVTEYNPT